MSQISFFKAAKRLHADAAYMAADLAQNRHVNAGHFFGLAAECGLKYLLVLAGGLSRNPETGDLLSQHRPHIDRLVDPAGLAQNYRQAISGSVHAGYFANLPSLALLRSWKAHFRYYDATNLNYPAAEEAGWREASREIQAALDSAKLDGQPIY